MKKLLLELLKYTLLLALGFVGGYFYRQIEIVQNTRQLLKEQKTVFSIEDLGKITNEQIK